MTSAEPLRVIAGGSILVVSSWRNIIVHFGDMCVCFHCLNIVVRAFLIYLLLDIIDFLIPMASVSRLEEMRKVCCAYLYSVMYF